MARFLIVIEKASSNYSAYAPDLPGCVAVGDTLAEVEQNMAEAMHMHIEGMREDSEPVPVPQSTACYIEIAPPDFTTRIVPIL
jgi:predicted RNase H-like HicB family nuclease